MIQKPLTFLFILIFAGVLFLTNIAFADDALSLTQSYDNVDNNWNNAESVNIAMQQRLKDMLLEQTLDQYFSYELGVNRSTGIKVHSSVGLKLRSDKTFLQFQMTF